MTEKQMSMDEIIEFINSHSGDFFISVLMQTEEGDSCGKKN